MCIWRRVMAHTYMKEWWHINNIFTRFSDYMCKICICIWRWVKAHIHIHEWVITHCHPLQHTAPHCNTHLQRVFTRLPNRIFETFFVVFHPHWCFITLGHCLSLCPCISKKVTSNRDKIKAESQFPSPILRCAWTSAVLLCPCRRVRVCTNTQKYTNQHPPTRRQAHTYKPKYMDTHMCTRVRVRAHTHTRTHTHAHTHKHGHPLSHTHIYTDTHTDRHQQSLTHTNIANAHTRKKLETIGMRLTNKLVTCSFVVIRIAPQIVVNRLSVIKMMSSATASSGMHVHWMPTYLMRLFCTYSVRMHPYTHSFRVFRLVCVHSYVRREIGKTPTKESTYTARMSKHVCSRTDLRGRGASSESEAHTSSTAIFKRYSIGGDSVLDPLVVPKAIFAGKTMAITFSLYLASLVLLCSMVESVAAFTSGAFFQWAPTYAQASTHGLRQIPRTGRCVYLLCQNPSQLSCRPYMWGWEPKIGPGTETGVTCRGTPCLRIKCAGRHAPFSVKSHRWNLNSRTFLCTLSLLYCSLFHP